jgi:putative nucleotidyltransferase with HDIG domain
MERVADFETKLKFDAMTYQHSLNVATLSVQLSKQSPYDLDEVLVYYSGLFHDIGKSVTPLDILRKDAALSEEEFRQLKEHPKQGFRILQQYRFPSEILFAALLHHEKFDGSGYPIGFIGKEIPAAARIVSICDVFDALTSDRTYRKAYSEQKALDIMEYSRSQFDPELLDIFFSRYEECKIIKFSV